MVARLGWADAVAGAPSYVGRALRQLMSPLVAGASSARPLGSMSGVRPGTPASIVTASSTAWTVTPFAGVIDLEAAAIAGPYPFAFDANVTGSVTAANASYARVDILYVRVSDPSEGDGSSVPLIEVLYLAGTAAAVPVAPSVPARSFVIANLNIPVSGGGSPTVTFNAPYVVAAGAPILQSTLVALNTVTGTLGQSAIIHSDAYNNGFYQWSGAAWVVVAGDTGWNTATLSGAWVAYSGGTARYRRLGSEVALTGTVASGTTLVTTLPVGFRPTSTLYFLTVADSGATQFSVAANGAVTVLAYVAGGKNTIVSLNGIRFSVN